MNEKAAFLIASMNMASQSWAEQQKEADSEAFAFYVSTRDHIVANWKERIRELGLDPESDEVRIVWAMATFTAEEHLQQYCLLWKELSGIPVDQLFPAGLLMQSLWEVTRT